MSRESVKNLVAERYSDQMFHFLRRRGEMYARENEKMLASLTSEEEIRSYQRKIREVFFKGIRPEFANAKLHSSEKTGEIDRGNYKIEKIILTTSENVKITANVYVPESTAAQKPAVLFVCGHYKEAKAHEEYQYVQDRLARAGFLVLGMDPIGQGERFTYYDRQTGELQVDGCTEEHSYYGAKAAMCDMFLYNLSFRDMRIALDYLCSREDVDTERIAVTGNSGGGTQTAFLMLAQDDRVKAFAPATFITDYMMFYNTGEPQDDEQIVPQIVENHLGYTDIVIAVAPKPVILLGVNQDFFPIEGLMKVYMQAQRIYDIFGCRKNLEIVIDRSVHKYTAGLVRCMTDFFSNVFFGRDAGATNNFVPLPADSLSCCPHGQICLTGAKLPDAEIADYFHSHKQDNADFAKDLLLKQVMKDRAIQMKKAKKLGGYRVGEIYANAFALEPVPAIMNTAVLYSLKRAGWENQKKILLFTDEGNLKIENSPESIGEYLKEGYAVIVVDTCNYGYLYPKQRNKYDAYGFYGMNYFFAHHFFFQGDSIAAFKSFEILSDILNIREQFGNIEKIIGEGLTENNLCVAAFLYDLQIPLVFSLKKFSLRDIIENRLYDTRDIRSVVYPGLALYYDFDKIKSDLTEKKL